MTRPTVNLLNGPVEIRREKGKTVIRDDAAGYYRVLQASDVTRLAKQATALTHDHVLCEGKIPKRD